MFRPSVAFMVNTILEGPSALKNLANFILVENTVLEAPSEAECVPLSALPKVVSASETASTTSLGFILVVAALSKYIILLLPISSYFFKSFLKFLLCSHAIRLIIMPVRKRFRQAFHLSNLILIIMRILITLSIIKLGH